MIVRMRDRVSARVRVKGWLCYQVESTAKPNPWSSTIDAHSCCCFQDKIRALCKEYLALGHKYFKMKVGNPDVEDDIL